MTSPLPGALGAIDWLALGDGAAEASGWLLHPAQPIDAVRLSLDGVVLAEVPVLTRPDVAAVFSGVPHAAASGLRVRHPFTSTSTLLRVETIGLAGGRPVAATEEYWPAGGMPPMPAPGPTLMERVSAGTDAARFDRAGLNIAAQLLAAVRAHLPGAARPRLLDWGCGPARATRFMACLWPGLRPVGCDIDAEAIAWCRDNLADVAFHATAPFPPLPFADGSFDAVVAASVMTHLAGPVQRCWLDEIRRVLAPSGVLVASVHGPLAAIVLPAEQQAALARDGLLDGTPDPRLDGIAPAGYYRATYQTETHLRRHWTRGFTVRAYRAGGLANWQDLVVLQRS